MIVTLTGPSCAGKTTLENMLCAHGCVKAISTTTRPMRNGEVNGESYYFVSREQFAAEAMRGNFVESVGFNGHHYGLSAAEVNRLREQGKIIVVVCEPLGASMVSDYCEAHSIPHFKVFVNAKPEVIAERFLSRFASELEADRVGYTNQLVDTYASRLAVMMSQERAWVTYATSHAKPYDMVLDSFDERNDKAVVEEILHFARATKEAA